MSDVNHKNFEQIESLGWASRLPKRTILAGVMALAMSSSALAETCTANLTQAAAPGVPLDVNNAQFISFAVASIAGNAVSAITTAQTAFLLQSTAFVSNPGNPQPDQQGSGVWTRAVGGSVDLKQPSTQNFQGVVPAVATATGGGPVNCDTKVRTKFYGAQFGHDIARLNHNGWNINFGTTAGFIESQGETLDGIAIGGTFNNKVRSPFAGTYLVLSKGGFFADALLRFEHYELTFNSPTAGLNNQGLNARGVTVAASAGYHHVIPGTRHFFEPSAGIVASRTQVDTLNLGGLVGTGGGVPGSVKINDIESLIGRAGFRVGTTLEGGQWLVQPFFAASIWHDFAKAPTANFTSDHTFFGLFGDPALVTSAYSGATVGTYGQFSFGMSGQLVGTGWVGFGRVDYRVGNRLEGWDGTAGLRYHFTPEPAVALVGKSPVYKAAPVVAAHNWTGVYAGINAGAVFGRSRTEIETDTLGLIGITSNDPRGSGAIYGAIIGYNWQFNPQWVGGIEANLDLTNMSGAKECAPLPNFPLDPVPPFGTRTPLYNTTCHFESKWLATLTGRLGYVWGRALMYVKGGGAWTRQNISLTCNGVGAPTTLNCTGPITEVDLAGNGSVELDRFGFTAGYGVEFALTSKWTARAETSYYNFGTKTGILSNGIPFSNKYEMISTKIGVAYKLTDR